MDALIKKSKEIDEEFNKIEYVHREHDKGKAAILESVKNEIKTLVPEMSKAYMANHGSQIAAEVSSSRGSPNPSGFGSPPTSISGSSFGQRSNSPPPQRLQVWGRADSSNQLVPDIPRNYLVAVSKIPKHEAYTNEWLIEETKEKLKENNYNVTVVEVANIDSSFPEARTRTVKMHLQCDGKLDPKTLYDERIWVKGLFVRQYRPPRNQNGRGPLYQNNPTNSNAPQAAAAGAQA